MTKKKKKRPPAKAPELDPSLEAVREILLSGDRETMDGRLSALETRVEEGLRAIRDDTRQRISNLGEQLRTDIKALSQRIRTLSKRVTAVSNTATEEIGRFDKILARMETDVEQSLEAQAEALTAEIETKTNRKDLAKILTTVASNLNGKRS